MSNPFRQLGRPALEGLAVALRAGHLKRPYTPSALATRVPAAQAAAVAAELQTMGGEGMRREHIARCLDLLAAERAETQRMTDRVKLVWSPAELDQVDCRDTPVVVQELFAQARESVLVVSFALDEGDKAAAIFGKLAARMDKDEDLEVRLIVNVHREHKDETPSG